MILRDIYSIDSAVLCVGVEYVEFLEQHPGTPTFFTDGATVLAVARKAIAATKYMFIT